MCRFLFLSFIGIMYLSLFMGDDFSIEYSIGTGSDKEEEKNKHWQ